MALKLGAGAPTALKVGSTAVSKAYLGSTVVYSTAAPSVTPALLLHFDGANNSTTFTDSSPSNLTFTRDNNPVISTAQSKFGGASGYFPGSGDYIQSEGSLFNFSTQDWTIEFWMYPTLGSAFQCIFTIQGGINVHLYDDNAIYVNDAVTGAGGFTGGSFGTNQWYHIAITRQSGTLRVFSNGSLVGSSSTPFGSSVTPVIIGGAYSGFFHGYLDELRVVQGTAIYTNPAGFTPPTAPF